MNPSQATPRDASSRAGLERPASSHSGSAPARLSRLTAVVPAVVSKVFALRDGKVQKTISANVCSGTVETIECVDLAQFADVLQRLRPSQCLLYGQASTPRLELVTDAAWERNGRPAHQVSRTDRNFRWPEGSPGILMLDHDPAPGMDLYRPDELVALLRRHVPFLADVDMLTWPSASSLIFNGDTGECVNGQKGCRVYVMLDDGALIPKAGDFIVERLWAEGLGVFVVSKSGRLLERGLFDTSVWQPSRIDFAAGAVCEAPLEQRRGAPELHHGMRRRAALALHAAPMEDGPSLSPDQQAAAQAHKERARAVVKDEAVRVGERFEADQVQRLRDRALSEGRSVEEAQAQAVAAVRSMLRAEHPELHGDVAVGVIGEGGETAWVTVREILRDRARFDLCLTLDPVEPEYDGGRVVGKLFLSGAVPRLFSFARGGRAYKLVARHGDVEVAPGALCRTVDSAIAVLRLAGDVFNHGGALASVSADGRLLTIPESLLSYVLSSRVGFFSRKRDRRTGDLIRCEMDPPSAVCKSVHALGNDSRWPVLNAVITAPTVVGNRVIDRPGYDRQTGLLLVNASDDRPFQPPENEDAVREAFTRLQDHFKTFPFDTPADRGVFLAALFTAVMRPGLRTAPGFAFDAPAQGTGKSLLADCLAIISTGEAPSALPHLYDDEGETRKRLVSLLYADARVMIWDNIKGTFDSAVLASLLTSERFNDRLLGETRLLALPNRMLALFNGNNMALRGELTRRILTCRLDARMERPYRREFATSPRETCKSLRQDIVRDVLTIVCGYQTLGSGEARGVLGSFEEWSKAVLHPLHWAIAVSGDSGVASPLEKLQLGEDDDEDLVALRALHEAWYLKYGNEPKTVRQVLDDATELFPDFDTSDPRPSLSAALDDFMACGRFAYWGKSNNHLARELGKQLAYRKGRMVGGGRYFDKHPQLASGGVAQWVAAIRPDAKEAGNDGMHHEAQ